MALKVDVRAEIARDIGQVWSVVRDFGGLARRLLPGQQVESEGQGLGAIRHIHTPDGGLIVEQVLRYDDAGHSFDYAVIETRPSLPIDGRLFKLALRFQDLSLTEIVWSTELPDDSAPELQDMLRVAFAQGLAALKSIERDPA
jgi:hypothetical protein